MHVPNYVPEPLEVPGNVTQMPYAIRLSFVRRVVLLHLLGLAAVAAFACLPLTPQGILRSGGALLGLLALLEIARILLRGRPIEAVAAAWLSPFLFFLAGLFARDLHAEGHPVWAPAAGALCMGVYTLLCGRDFSFVGCWFLSLIASSTCVASVANGLAYAAPKSAWALAANAALLSYWIYDLAYLGYRRRAGEEVAAVVDLYRDVLNIFGYIPRVIGHWRKHQIFRIPKDWLHYVQRGDEV